MKACDGCGSTEWHHLWGMTWHNGVFEIDKWYCPKCVRDGKSPPLREVRKTGSVRKFTRKDFPSD